MKSRIFASLWDCFRGAPNKIVRFELSLQTLAFAKLLQSSQFSASVQLQENGKPKDFSELLAAFDRLATLKELGEDRLAFESTSLGRFQLDEGRVASAINTALDLAQRGMLDRFELTEDIYSMMGKMISARLIPSEVVSLMVLLAGDLSGKQVYCPYDDLCLLAQEAIKKGAEASIEVGSASPVPWLINILQNTRVEIRPGDPVRQPSYVKQGKLIAFDVSISFPPFGIKYDAEVLEKDWFDRFREPTTSGSVLSIRHILAQTKQRAIIAVPNSILFSRGAEHSLREYLLAKRAVECVVSMPPALLPFTNVPFSILVLNRRSSIDYIRFVDGSSDRFYVRDGRNRSQLVNWQELFKTVREGVDESIAVNVPIKDVLAKKAQLEVSRYLQPQEHKRVEAILDTSGTRHLGEVVEFIRPLPKLAVSTGEDELTVFEIGVSDFPDYGYISLPERQITINSRELEEMGEKGRNTFLRPLDVVIAIKGNAGKVAIAPEDTPPIEDGGWVVNQSCLILRARKEIIDPRVLFMYLRSQVGQAVLKTIVSGATIPLIHLRLLQEIQVIIPSQSEGKRVIKTFDQQVSLQSQIEKLRHQQEQLNKFHWQLAESEA